MNNDSQTLTIQAILYGVLSLWLIFGTYLCSETILTGALHILSDVSLSEVQLQLVTDDAVNYNSGPSKPSTVTVSIIKSSMSNLSWIITSATSVPLFFLVLYDFIAEDKFDRNRKYIRAVEVGPATLIGVSAVHALLIAGIAVIFVPVGESRRLLSNSSALDPYFVGYIFLILLTFWIIFAIQNDSHTDSQSYITFLEAFVTFPLFPMLFIFSM